MDRTQTGHCLGIAAQGPMQALSERELSPVSFAILRCLLHASMLLGVESNSQVIKI